MIQKRKYAPMNSMVIISGPGKLDVPEWGEARPKIVATRSCIFSICLPEVDGETKFVLGPSSELEMEQAPDFDDVLEVREKSLIISEVDESVVLKTPVPSRVLGIRIWHSHPIWPEVVTVGWYVPPG